MHHSAHMPDMGHSGPHILATRYPNRMLIGAIDSTCHMLTAKTTPVQFGHHMSKKHLYSFGWLHMCNLHGSPKMTPRTVQVFCKLECLQDQSVNLASRHNQSTNSHVIWTSYEKVRGGCLKQGCSGYACTHVHKTATCHTWNVFCKVSDPHDTVSYLTSKQVQSTNPRPIWTPGEKVGGCMCRQGIGGPPRVCSILDL